MSVTQSRLAVLILTLLSTGSGCVALRESTSNCVTWMQARSAYRCAACPPDCRHAEKHYARGWRQGYIDVAQGGEGCAPPLPPDCYQSCVYQCSEGQAAIRSWYCGYQDGAQAAFACGVQQYNYIPSPVCNSAPSHDSSLFETQHEEIASPAESMPEPQAMHSATPTAPANLDRLPPLKLVADGVPVSAGAMASEAQAINDAAGVTSPAEVMLHKNPLRKAASVFRMVQTGQ
jgi:hypothetical protein